MKLKFLSICSGIEAASVAFHPLGWQALAFAEIEPFPCALLAHHYPHIPNLGDLTRWRTWPASLLVQVELLCGGTPCQAFSVAGLRNSLADARGNLTLIFCELYAHINTLRRAAGLPPALLLWENVPGVLNTPDNAFGCFLAGIAGESDALQPPGGRWENAGYVSGPEAAAAYRTLDAQYFGLPQRRRRVFVVGSADPAFDPAAVLFEFTGLRRDTPPSRRTRQDTAPTLSARTKGGGGLGTDADLDGACIAEKVESQGYTAAETGAGFWTDDGLARLRVTTAPTQPQNIVADLAPTLNAHFGTKQGLENQHIDGGAGLFAVEITHSLRAEVHDASEDGTGRGTPIIPCAQAYRTSGNCGAWPTGEKIDALTTGTDRTSHLITQEPFAFDLRGREGGAMPEDPHATAAMRASSGGSSRSYVASPLPFDTTQITSAANRSHPKSGDPCHPLASGAHPPAVAIGFEPRFYLRDNKTGGSPSDIAVLKADACKAGDGSPHVAYNARAYNLHSANSCAMQKDGEGNAAFLTDTARTVDTTGFTPNQGGTVALSSAWRVRRLTPEECEILQGFPIGYTLIPGHSPKKRKGQDLSETIAYLISLGIPEPDAALLAHSPDGPRYKALGNSWAVPCARWIAHRIASHIAQLSHNTLRAGSADILSAPVPDSALPL